MNTKELSTYLARVVLQVPDQHPKTHQAYTHEVLFTLRPGWSNSGAYQRSLPGGKLETQDFNGVVQSSNELFELPTSAQLDALIAIGFYTTVRELSEELGRG